MARKDKSNSTKCKEPQEILDNKGNVDIIVEGNFKYQSEEVDLRSEEYKFLKDFFNRTRCLDPRGHGISIDFKSKNTRLSRKGKVYRIYKLVENKQAVKSKRKGKNNSIAKVMEGKRGNLMLFHGTNYKGATAIFKEGYKNSRFGWFGTGVYMTDCSTTAMSYAEKSFYDHFVFVNEVLRSETLQTFEHKTFDHKESHDTVPEYPFEKHVLEKSAQAAEKDYREDGCGRKYRNVPNDYTSALDEYVAHESITIPRYLIKVEPEYKVKGAKNITIRQR